MEKLHFILIFDRQSKHNIRKKTHKNQLGRRPFPELVSRFTNGQGAHTLHGKGIEQQQGNAGGQIEQGLLGLGIDFRRHSVFIGILFVAPHTVNGGQSSNKNLPGSKRGEYALYRFSNHTPMASPRVQWPYPYSPYRNSPSLKLAISWLLACSKMLLLSPFEAIGYCLGIRYCRPCFRYYRSIAPCISNQFMLNT